MKAKQTILKIPKKGEILVVSVPNDISHVEFKELGDYIKNVIKKAKKEGQVLVVTENIKLKMIK